MVPFLWLEYWELAIGAVSCRTEGRGAMFRCSCYLLLILSIHSVVSCIGGPGKAEVPYFPTLAMARCGFTKCMLSIWADRDLASSETSSVLHQVPYRIDRLKISACSRPEFSIHSRVRVDCRLNGATEMTCQPLRRGEVEKRQ